MTLTVRPPTTSDAGDIARVHVAAWQTAYKGLVPQSYLDALDISERTELWSKILAGVLTVPGIARPVDVVATLNGELVGFANIGRFRDAPDDTSAGELWALYVDPASWGAGVGDALMAATLDEFERLAVEQSFLWVLEGNARACRFYERHGWRPDGLTKTFEADGIDVAEVRYSRSR